ncbi:MAG: hypothetical protein JWN70_5351 [Planctomycetaceae bacterium]|nr:hypothetical protein [Planctomycetaceae bacterium]
MIVLPHSRMTCVIFLICLSICLTNGHGQEVQGPSLLEAVRSRDLDRVAIAIEAAKDTELQGDITELVRLLVALIEADKYGQPEVALRALAKLGSRAVPAVPVLCQKLDDRRHWIRAGAIDALTAMGDPAVGAARGLLRDKSRLVRAGATEVLGRLRRLDVTETETLAKDSEPRVRAAVARVLSHMGKTAIPSIVSLLTDAEPAVGVAAVRALQTNHADPEAAIAGLMQAVSRPGVGAPAAAALANYGIEARRAIPAIIKAYPIGPADDERFLLGEAAEAALRHIGPPHPADLPLLVECLQHPQFEARILAVERLALLGAAGATAAPNVIATANGALDEYVRLKKVAKSNTDNPLADDNSGRIAVLAELSSITLWRITHDAPRCLQLIETIVERTNKPLIINQDSPWTEFDVDALPAIEKMLSSKNPNIQQTALHGIVQMGPRAVSLKQRLLDMLRKSEGRDKSQVAETLAGLGPMAADIAEPALWNVGLSLEEIAAFTIPLDLHSAETIASLEEGLLTGHRGEADECLRALIRVSRKPRRTATLIVKAFEDRQVNVPVGLEQMGPFKAYHELLIPFYLHQISERDIKFTQAAMDRLAEMGDKGKPVIPEIEKHLQNADVGIRLRAAAAIYRITQNRGPLEHELKGLFEPQKSGRFVDLAYGFHTISELKADGAPFLSFVVKWARQPRLGYSRQAIETLVAVGTPEAIAVLREVAQSTDWEVRSVANEALKKKR